MAILSAAVLATGCIQETESDFDKIVQRDDALLEAHISSNNIEATKTQLGYYYRKDVEVDEAHSSPTTTLSVSTMRYAPLMAI